MAKQLLQFMLINNYCHVNWIILCVSTVFLIVPKTFFSNNLENNKCQHYRLNKWENLKQKYEVNVFAWLLFILLLIVLLKKGEGQIPFQKTDCCRGDHGWL